MHRERLRSQQRLVRMRPPCLARHVGERRRSWYNSITTKIITPGRKNSVPGLTFSLSRYH